MTDLPLPIPPLRCEVRVDGHLDDRWSEWFGGAGLTRERDGTTLLRCSVADQSELHGLLAKVRDLGATLLSLEVLDPSPRGPAVAPDAES